MAQENKSQDKPKLDLEKMVQQFKLLGAIETKDPNVIKDVFNSYTFSSSENDEFKKYIADGLTVDESAKDYSMKFATNLANTYYESKSKAKVGELKQVYEKLEYKIPKMDNIISNDISYKQLLDEFKRIDIKKKEAELKNSEYKPSEKEEKWFLALRIFEDIEKLCKEKLILKYNESQKNKEIELINKKYEPKKPENKSKDN